MKSRRKSLPCLFVILVVILNFSPALRAENFGQPRQDSTTAFDTSGVVIQEGVGFGDFRFDNQNLSVEFIKSWFGQPDEEKDYWISYWDRYGIAFFLSGPNGPLAEIQLNKGFKGRLSSGISLSSSKADVFAQYGSPIKEEQAPDIHSRNEDRILSINDDRSKIVYAQRGLTFWFKGNDVEQIILYKGLAGTPPPQEPTRLSAEPVQEMPKEPKASLPPVVDIYTDGTRQDTSGIVVTPGVGFGEFILGDERCTKSFVKKKLGRSPAEYRNRLYYRDEWGVEFIFGEWGGPLRQIYFDQRFGGKLDSGISMASSKEQVFSTYGAPIDEVTTKEDVYYSDVFKDRTLFINSSAYLPNEQSQITYLDKGLVFWFYGNSIWEMAVFKGIPCARNSMSRLYRFYSSAYSFVSTWFGADSNYWGTFIVAGFLLLFPLNWRLARGKKGFLTILPACLSGIVIFAGPGVVYALSQPGSFIGALALGIMCGLGLFYQHAIELFISRRIRNQLLSFLPEVIAGILLLSVIYLLFWVTLVIVTYPYFTGDNSELLFIVPIGLIIISLIAFLNTIMYSLMRRRQVIDDRK